MGDLVKNVVFDETEADCMNTRQSGRRRRGRRRGSKRRRSGRK